MIATEIKFCGLTDPADIPAALLAGATHLGFVFHPPSPRHVGAELAGEMAGTVPKGILRVALTVDADDAALDALVAAVPIDMIQLHGAETPERVAAVKSRTGLPVMKAVGIRDADDLAAIDRYAGVADRLLIDAKPAPDADRPGGNGIAFDWRLLQGREIGVPWMLAGGLTPDNVADAVHLTGAPGVDVSSGVESAPGVKDAGKMAAFGAALR